MLATISETAIPSPSLLVSDDERRECPRVPLESLTAWFDDRAHAGWGDVSTGGAFWHGVAPLPAEGTIELSFELPDTRIPLHLRAEVVSAREERPGQLALHLRFVEIPFEAERRIARHVDDCMLLSGRALCA